jgi:uncharacterized protein (UPF0297 family)
MIYKKIVDKELSIFFKEQLKEAQKIDKTSHQVIKALEENLYKTINQKR